MADLNPIENLWAELKKHVRARRPTHLTQLHQLLVFGSIAFKLFNLGPNSPNILWEACGRLPESLTQVKQFKGNATKY